MSFVTPPLLLLDRPGLEALLSPAGLKGPVFFAPRAAYPCPLWPRPLLLLDCPEMVLVLPPACSPRGVAGGTYPCLWWLFFFFSCSTAPNWKPMQVSEACPCSQQGALTHVFSGRPPFFLLDCPEMALVLPPACSPGLSMPPARGTYPCLLWLPSFFSLLDCPELEAQFLPAADAHRACNAFVMPGVQHSPLCMPYSPCCKHACGASLAAPCLSDRSSPATYPLQSGPPRLQALSD
jgi:hypothetical protein